uniref:Uncharacterized protein n=1 Tax=Arundo donax TaxID=35708 RepID=A0A0A9DWD7_ARUDO
MVRCSAANNNSRCIEMVGKALSGVNGIVGKVNSFHRARSNSSVFISLSVLFPLFADDSFSSKG